MSSYGLISSTDAATLKKVIDLICDDFDCETINSVEIGLYAGLTSKYIVDCIKSNGKYNVHTGIDNLKDGEEIKHFPEDAKLVIGNSNEVYNSLKDNSQHLIVIDGNHSFPYVVSDYYCYRYKVKVGGFLCFHDAAPQAQGRDWQRMGSEQDPDMYISVLKALKSVEIWDENCFGVKEWQLAFHEWDENDRCGGFAIFKRLA